ncbi:MAG: GDP-mannose 4,6-dehydratase [Candidatus Aminicenantales bacterium]|jgi:GDP-4-dehydro-6-deoxy-D-mannose reductase
MRKVLILGINGFTGIHFQNYIQNRQLNIKYSLCGVDLQICKRINMKYIRADVTGPGVLARIIRREAPDYIINLIGTFTGRDFNEYLRLNVIIPQVLLESVRQAGEQARVEKILLAGSAAEYGTPERMPIREHFPLNPVNFYGLSKVMQAQLARYYYSQYHVPVVLARAFNIIGDHLSTALSIGSFIQQIREARDGDTIYTGNLNTRRDFLDIDDVIDGYWKILTRGRPGEIYNLCSGRSVFISDILDALIRKSGKKINIVVKAEYVKKKDIADIYGDNSRLKKATGWRARVSLEQSINRIFHS